MRGEFARGGLKEFRERVGLRPRGRVSDDWDQELGVRELRSKEQGGRVRLKLWRYDDDDWLVDLTCQDGDPLPSERIEELRGAILDAAAHAGLTVTAQLPPPPGTD
ncbi:hypothetical protein [Streptomyces albus]|uniref:hypothetical protein n=1 Tax=Streptomyces albus TaxID=1888 RepID=UPI00131B5B77|nr:hypothetical protein [Streptomyces albus]